MLQTSLKDKMFCLNKKIDDAIFEISLNIFYLDRYHKRKNKKL